MNCPICKSKDAGLFHENVWSDQNKKVYRCQDCDIAFIHPMMSHEEEVKFYSEYNKHAKKRGFILGNNSAELHQKSKPIALERWQLIGSFFKKGARVLEVGCSTGAFLEVCSRDCSCWCVEPADANRTYASRFANEAYADMKNIPDNEEYDLICMFHVFEHLSDPRSFLKRAGKLLRAGGLIIVEVPHIEDPLLSVYNLKSFKDFYFQPMHPYIYSLKALRRVFNESGFVEKETTFHQRYGLDNHLAWLKNGRPSGDEALSAVVGKNDQYRNRLEKARKTDTLFYIAQKI